MSSPDLAAPICAGCTHLFTDLLDPKCDAFPVAIPRPILLSQVDHRNPVDGDQGIQFEPESAADEEYADFIFPGK